MKFKTCFHGEEAARTQVRAGAEEAVVVGASAAGAEDLVVEVQVEAGKRSTRFSPIIEAIREVESKTTAEIRVHLTRSWFEKNAYRHAWRLFEEFGMSKTTHRNGVLIYVNLRRRKFAVVGDSGFHSCVSPHYWEKMARDLSVNLRATHSENAVAMIVRELGATLIHFFPSDLDRDNPNELSDEISSD